MWENCYVRKLSCDDCLHVKNFPCDDNSCVIREKKAHIENTYVICYISAVYDISCKKNYHVKITCIQENSK